MFMQIRRLIDRLNAEVNDTTVLRGKNKETGEETVIYIKPRLDWDKNWDKNQQNPSD